MEGGREIKKKELKKSVVYLKSGETPDKIEHEANLKSRDGRHGWELPHAEDGRGGEEGT